MENQSRLNFFWTCNMYMYILVFFAHCVISEALRFVSFKGQGHRLTISVKYSSNQFKVDRLQIIVTVKRSKYCLEISTAHG